MRAGERAGVKMPLELWVGLQVSERCVYEMWSSPAPRDSELCLPLQLLLVINSSDGSTTQGTTRRPPKCQGATWSNLRRHDSPHQLVPPCSHSTLDPLSRGFTLTA